MLARPVCTLLVVTVLAACLAPAFAGAYVPFDPKLWVLPTNFKIQKYYSGDSLGLGTEYGNLPKSRSLAVSGLSKLGGPVITYVSTKGAASQAIYAMVDRFGRGQADYAFKIMSFKDYGILANTSAGTPNAIAWVGGETGSTQGTLYVLVSNYWVNNVLYKVTNIDSYALTQTPVTQDKLFMVRDDFPNDSWHGWRYIRFDKNKNLYIGLGANCNACNVYGNATDNGSMYSKAYDGNMQNIHNYYQKSTPCTFNATGCAKYQFASIYKLTPPYTHVAAPGFVQYASGVRNTVGFDFHPSSGALYFTDNGRDDIGGSNTSDPAVIARTRNTPDCEFNVVAKQGDNYGFPFCHTGPVGDPTVNPDATEVYPHLRNVGIGADVVDPDLNAGQTMKVCNGATYKRALQAMGPHTAPLGMRFYKAPYGDKNNFPTSYNNLAFIAQRGSWDRDTAIGARVMTVKLSGTATTSTVASYNYFLAGGVPCDYGSRDGPSCNTPGSSQRALQSWVGRPVDVEYLPDSTILVSDDEMGAVYRILYCSPTAAAAWGGNAPYGVGRCGRTVHPTTADKITATPITATPAGAPNLASGCQVNLGAAGLKAYKRCILFDLSGLSGRGAHTYIAWNLITVGASNTLVLDMAVVNKDYTEVNGNGWFGWGFSPTNGGATMPGTNVFMSTASGANAATTTYKMGTGKAGMPGFKTTTDFLYPGSPITAAMAGEALVTSFQAVVPKSLASAGGALTSIAAFGDRDSVGANLKHWAIDIIKLTLTIADKNVAASTGLPIVNPASASEPSYTPACPSSALTAGDCTGNPSIGCLNGETFNSKVSLNSYPGVTMDVYSTLAGGVLTLGISANVGSFNGANGYAVFCNSTGNAMGNNDCMFIRKASSSAAEAVNYILDGYSGYQPTLPAKCSYSNNQALATSTVTSLVGRFTMPFSGPLKVRFGGGAYPGGTGIDGMVKHPAGSPPFFACMSDNGSGGVDITPVGGAGTAFDSTLWASTACSGVAPLAGRKLLSF